MQLHKRIVLFRCESVVGIAQLKMALEERNTREKNYGKVRPKERR